MINIEFRIYDLHRTAIIIFLGIILVRFLLRKAPKKYSYALWSILGLRLIVPFPIESIFSIFNLTKSINSYNNEVIGQLSETIQPNYIINTYDQHVLVSSTDYYEILDIDMGNLEILFVFWIAIAIFFLIFVIVSYVQTKKELDYAILLKDNIYQSELIQSPLIFGYIEPKIYLPYDIDEKMMDSVLKHEQYHLKRKDHLIKLFAYLLCIIWWFNPIVWVAYHLLCKDMEMSCDEYVLKDNSPKEYSNTLLYFATKESKLIKNPVAFGEDSIKERIKHALTCKPVKKSIEMISVIICTLSLLAFTTNPTHKSLSSVLNEKSFNNLQYVKITMYAQRPSKVLFHEYELTNELIIDPFEDIFNEVNVVNKGSSNFDKDNLSLIITMFNENNEEIIFKFDRSYCNFIIEYQGKIIDEYQIENPIIIKQLSNNAWLSGVQFKYVGDRREDILDMFTFTLRSKTTYEDNTVLAENAHFGIYRNMISESYQVVGPFEFVNNQVIITDRNEPYSKYVFDILEENDEYTLIFNKYESDELPDYYNIISNGVELKSAR